MKTDQIAISSPRTTLAATFVALAGLVAGMPGAHAAIPPPPPPLPAADPFVEQIVEISPSVATVGQVITVRTAPTETALAVQRLAALRPTLVPRLPNLPPFNPSHPTAALATRIYFSDASGRPDVLAGDVTPLGAGRYRVVVPPNAHTGTMRFESVGGNSYSTERLTVVFAGYSLVNLSQFNVVSVKIDNQERLASQTIPASPPDDPDMFVGDIGATNGNHSILITLGPSSDRPVIVYGPFTAQALNPTNVIEIGVMLVGDYFTASPNASTSGDSRTASWQTLVLGPGAIPSVNGFEFTFDSATEITTWQYWIGDKSNVQGTGLVTEPTNWELNATTATIQLRSANGGLFSNVTVDLLHKSLEAADGSTYELQ